MGNTPLSVVVVEWGEIAAWVFGVAAKSVLLWRLQAQGLHHTYRFFWLYLVAGVVRSAGLLTLYFTAGQEQTTTYGIAYVTTAPILAVLRILVVLELYSLVLQNHPGIETLGRWVIKGGLVVAVVIASLMLYPDFAKAEPTYILLFYVTVFERAVNSALLLLLAIITGFLVWFPVPLNRNTILHALVFGAYFSGSAILLLFRNVWGIEVVRTLSTINLVVQNLCLAAVALARIQQG